MKCQNCNKVILPHRQNKFRLPDGRIMIERKNEFHLNGFCDKYCEEEYNFINK